MIWFDTPQNVSGNSKWFPELFLVAITADGVHHLNSLPCDTQWRFHTCWLPSTCVFPSFSLSHPLHPFCSPSWWGMDCDRGLWSEFSRFWGQARGLIEKSPVLKHGFFPGSVSLNAHWSLLFVCLFLFNSNVQITACCTSLESLNLLPPRNKARCWQSDSGPFLIILPKVGAVWMWALKSHHQSINQ